MVAGTVTPDVIMGQVSNSLQGEQAITLIVGDYVILERPGATKASNSITPIVTDGIVDHLEVPRNAIAIQNNCRRTQIAVNHITNYPD